MNVSPSPPPTQLDSLLLKLSWSLFGITLAVVALRLCSDLIMRSFRLSSFLALVAFLLALAGQVLITLAVHWGLGRHMEGLNPEEIRMTMTYIWQAQPIQLLANTAGKVSIAALLVTLHGPKFAKSKTIFIWTLAAISTIFVIIAIVMIYAQCSPVAKLWHESLPGSCDGRNRNQTFAYVQGVVSSIVDLALAVYPIFLFWDLRIQLLKKLILSVLFAFGIVACICAIVRTVNISKLGQTSDVSYAVGSLVIWNTAEMYLVLLAGSLPGLRPLFNKRVKKPINHNSIYGYSSRQSRKSSKHDLVVRLSNLPSSQSKAYATISNINNRTHSDSTENFFKNINSGQIIKTTEVNMATLIPPPSKRQRVAVAEKAREQQDIDTIPGHLGSVRVHFFDQSTGKPTGAPVAIPVADATVKNLELLLNTLQGN
ncbi:MAG: hypothetical protein Q9228_005451, partial [Teloschistes exilis]